MLGTSWNDLQSKKGCRYGSWTEDKCLRQLVVLEFPSWKWEILVRFVSLWPRHWEKLVTFYRCKKKEERLTSWDFHIKECLLKPSKNNTHEFKKMNILKLKAYTNLPYKSIIMMKKYAEISVLAMYHEWWWRAASLVENYIYTQCCWY